jgi:palmitoyltransferase
MARRAADKRVNLAVARIIPSILIGVFGYASYAITKPLCGQHPLPQSYQPQFSLI